MSKKKNRYSVVSSYIADYLSEDDDNSCYYKDFDDDDEECCSLSEQIEAAHRQNEFDEDSLIDDAENCVPQVPVHPSDLGGKRNVAIDQLTYNVIQAGRLKSTAGGQIYAYDSEAGHYYRVDTPEKLVYKLLSHMGNAQRLSVKDVRDIVLKIRWDPWCECNADDFNNDPNKINTRAGILDLENGKVENHSPEHLFTYVVNAEYLGDEPVSCPTFEHFCQTSLRPLYAQEEDAVSTIIKTKRQLLLEMIGYACCDSNAGKCALFFKGEPDTGKSVIANFISRLFSPDLISNIQLHKLSDRFNKAALFGKKLNVAGEIQGKRLSEITTFKSITGSDPISAEYKGQDLFSFTPKCKLIFAGNALPGTLEADATKAFVNRLNVLLFNHSIPKEEQDKELPNKLWDERDAIFTLAVHALQTLRRNNYRFTLPQESKDFLDSFASRGNSLQLFIADCCYFGPEARVHNAVLLSAYADYCEKNGLVQFGKCEFYEMLSGIPGVCAKRLRMNKENRQGHVGIGLIPSVAEKFSSFCS